MKCRRVLFISFFLLIAGDLLAQTAMVNVPGRNTISLNGQWKAIIDINDVGIGNWSAIWKDKIPQGKTDFVEYSFEGGPVLNVPGDFNSQLTELKYYESTIWYKKTFIYHVTHRVYNAK